MARREISLVCITVFVRGTGGDTEIKRDEEKDRRHAYINIYGI